MNLFGSYRSLCNNSVAAILAAIEIYNKPQFPYRDECFSILLINAWELLLKAILSKNKNRIYYPKKVNEPYRTYSIHDALIKAKFYFPPNIDFDPVAQNINLLITYRNNSIHFYNQKDFSIVIFGLAQTSIVNFHDLMLSIFNIDIANEMSICLLPLSFGSRLDPIEFIQRSKVNPPKNKAVSHFIQVISETTKDLEDRSLDTSRFLTVFKVSMKSEKSVSKADVVMAIRSSDAVSDPLVIEKRVDPNITHPLRQKEVLSRVGPEISGVKVTSFIFQAIAWKFEIKNKPHLYWRSNKGELTRYSNDVPALLRNLKKSEIESAIIEFKEHQRKKRITNS